MTNLVAALEALLSPKSIAFLKASGEIAAREGLPLFLVGGSVRDLLLGKPVMDLDLVAQGDAPLLASVIAKELGGEVTARSQFGTAKISAIDIKIDIATARRESYSRPGALPTVRPGNLEDDLARRDFSINSMAMALSSEGFGQVFDPFRGEEDLKQKRIRVLHKESFKDDATRILRALRYEQRLGFQIEPETLALIERNKSYLEAISGDRIRNELERIFQEPEPEIVLARAAALGVLVAIHPSLRWPEELHRQVIEGRKGLLRWDPLVYLAFLATQLSPEGAKAITNRLNLPSHSSKVVADTIEFKEKLISLNHEGVKPSGIYSICNDVSSEAIQAWAVFAPYGIGKKNLQRFLKELRYIKPRLAGHQILAMGVNKGPLVGQLLEEIRQARMDGQVSSEQDEELFVRRRIKELGQLRG